MTESRWRTTMVSSNSNGGRELVEHRIRSYNKRLSTCVCGDVCPARKRIATAAVFYRCADIKTERDVREKKITTNRYDTANALTERWSIVVVVTDSSGVGRRRRRRRGGALSKQVMLATRRPKLLCVCVCVSARQTQTAAGKWPKVIGVHR